MSRTERPRSRRAPRRPAGRALPRHGQTRGREGQGRARSLRCPHRRRPSPRTGVWRRGRPS
eukprot:1907302-Alexandrium_andersonii.AAC.1